jgi:hypothetical protein
MLLRMQLQRERHAVAGKIRIGLYPPGVFSSLIGL